MTDRPRNPEEIFRRWRLDFLKKENRRRRIERNYLLMKIAIFVVFAVVVVGILIGWLLR